MTVLPGKRIRWTRLVRRSHTPRAWLLSSMWLNTMKRPSSDHDGDMAMPGDIGDLAEVAAGGFGDPHVALVLAAVLHEASVERKKSPWPVRAFMRSAQKRSATSCTSSLVTPL